MMKHQTVNQVLQVFRLFRERYAAGEPLHKSYRRAVREVAKLHDLSYQTIGDGCRRRLKLSNIRELYDLLRHWMDGRPGPLMEQLKSACDPSTHDEIADFFGTSSSAAPTVAKQASPSLPEAKFTTFSFRLRDKDARMLRALAEIEGVSPPELIGDLVGSAVVERMKRVAEAMLRESKTPDYRSTKRQDILNVIRDHEAELRRLGVERLSLFGSMARGDWDATSDVDLAVRLTPEFSKGGLDYFGRIEALQERLAQILGRSVDLIEEPAEAAHLQERIDAERAVAF
jgi:uncharacterized protein